MPQPLRGEYMCQRSDHTGQEIKEKIPGMPEAVFDVVAKDPQVHHVTGNMRPSAMHEHGDEQGEVNMHIGWSQWRPEKLLPGIGICFNCRFPHMISSRYDLGWHCGI